MTQSKPPSRGLGRGLSALMSDVAPSPSADAPEAIDRNVPIEQVYPNPDQPRRSFDNVALEELAASIAAKGIIQPLIVRERPTQQGRFEIVAGERRWRAAQRAQLHQIPVIVRDFSDTEVLEVAIIENIQRSDLNPIDEAAGYHQLMEKFGHTQDAMGKALGKSRSHIANALRLLKLPSSIQNMLVDGKLTSGHARALIGHDDAEHLAATIVSRGLSVRDAERLAKSGAKSKKQKGKPKASAKDADTLQIEGDLSAQLGLAVQINHAETGESGEVVLKYKNLGQLDDLMRLLSGG